MTKILTPAQTQFEDLVWLTLSVAAVVAYFAGREDLALVASLGSNASIGGRLLVRRVLAAAELERREADRARGRDFK